LPEAIPWTTDDDRLLRKLRASGVPWRRISTVMDDRPIEELKARWAGLRKRGHNLQEVYGLSKTAADDWYYEVDDDEEEDRRVSFRRMRLEDVSPSQVCVPSHFVIATDVASPTTTPFLDSQRLRRCTISTTSSLSTRYYYSIGLPRTGGKIAGRLSAANSTI
jgi:hypothetical protein